MKIFQKAPLALAVTALMAAPAAFAQEADVTSSIESTFVNSIDVDLSHASDTKKTFRVDLRVKRAPANYSGALVDSKQFITGNEVTNRASDNNATVGSGAGSGATGNVGINVAAGDNNAQANDAALAASDASDVFGQSEIYTAQHVSGNTVKNIGSPNDAVLGSNSLQNASGNIGVNVAAGFSNAQQNSLSASANENGAGHARATVGGVQETLGNNTTNKGLTQTFTDTADVTLGGGMSGGYAGVGGGSYEGTWNQTNDVYPEIWIGGDEEVNHKIGGGAEYFGHADFDDKGTAGQDGRFEGDERGELGFAELGVLGMSGTLSGNVTTTNTVYIANENNATLGSNALQGASGNVGVNIAAGNNNLQRNSLSIASTTGGGSTPQ